jgi:hypothetical protein
MSPKPSGRLIVAAATVLAVAQRAGLHAPALFRLACNLVCSQSPLVGSSGSRISLDDAAAFAGISSNALGRHVDPRHQARPQEGVGAGEALALLYRQPAGESGFCGLSWAGRSTQAHRRPILIPCGNLSDAVSIEVVTLG